jgi:hypothetical protein
MSRRARIVTAALAGLVIAGGVGVVISVRNLEPRLREWVTSTLGRSLQSEVSLESIRLSWLPLRLHARGLTVRHHGRTDIPPLLAVSSFSVDLRPTDLWNSTVEHVAVEGLEINFPPKDESGKRPLPSLPNDDGTDRNHGDDGLIVKRLTASNTRLAIIPRHNDKNPKVWDIFELDMRNLGGAEPATFTAALVNPIPYGRIESTGTFGPWNSSEPGASPITGEYTFAADLGTINGLAGDLNAVGTMGGTIERIKTKGETRTPHFRLTELKGSALPLQTSYDATVDGTKGDVDLHRVDVQLGKSHFHAKGTVEGTRGVKGKRIAVNVKSDNADLAELLRFVTDGPKAPASGRLVIDTAFDLPQGDAPVLRRMELEGSIHARRVQFSNDGVQDKIDELSRRAQGRPADASIDDVASEMTTSFALRDGVLTYSGLSFNVTGARVQLAGTHSLRTRSVNLAGEVLLNATVSQTQTGVKRWLLKPIDPLFRKQQAGTRLVIKVEGTQDQPKIALDLGKTLKGQ